MSQDERLAAAEAENRRLRQQLEAALAQNALLLERVQELEGRLAKDSPTSGKPPARDGLARQTQRLRHKSGKQPGGQVGHPGETLRLGATPDTVVVHRPAVCAHGQRPLEGEPVVGRERRQGHELPPVRLVVPEHQARQVRCPACQQVSVGMFPACQQVSVGMFPAEAPSRAQYGPPVHALAVYLVEEQRVPLGWAGCTRCWPTGSAGGWGAAPWSRGSRRRQHPWSRWKRRSKRRSKRVPVLPNDETGVRRAGTLAWGQVASTARLPHYGIQAQRGHEATDAIGILPHFTGVSVQDGLASSCTSTRCRHALPPRAAATRCATSITCGSSPFWKSRTTKPAWAKELKGLLRAMPAAADDARAQGRRLLSDAQHAPWLVRYHERLAAGLAATPPPVRRPGQRGRRRQPPARHLRERLVLDQDQVLAFLDDLTIPFDNTQAARDRRPLTVQHRVSGCCRALRAGDAFARLRGDLSTWRKQGHALLPALQTVFAGQPLYPALG